MKSEIPKKFLTILLILDFTIGVAIVYQDEVIEFANFQEEDCERSKSYNLLGVRWQNFPIKYFIDNSVPDIQRNVIVASFDVWDVLTTASVFEETLDTNDSDLIVGYESLFWYEGAVGVTNLNGNDAYFSDRLIKNATLFLNSDEQFANIEFSCSFVPLTHTGPFDIESVTVHEIGHVLGLDHSVDEFATMYPFYIGTFQKTLSEGEIDGFHYLYDPILP